MQHYLARGPEEKELEEGVEDLLNHFVIFLLRSKQVLQQLNQVTVCDQLGALVVAANGAHQHHAF